MPIFFLTQIPITPSAAQGNMPCLSGVINQYTPVLGFGCDSSTLQVGNTGGFSSGNEVLLIQMQVPQVDLSNTASFGALLSNCCVGNYEINRIQSINGGTVQLQYALTRSYDLSGKIQLVKVPEYDSAMVCGITCQPWNGSIGGVLALDVKQKLVFNGDIDVSQKGFRGGRVEPLDIPWVFGEQQFFYPPQSTLAGEKGEGIVLIPTDHSYGRGRAANGGGGGNAHNGGGGGGANGGDGGNGGLEITNLPAAPTPNTDGIGGQAYFSSLADRMILGGGGGAGHANDTRGTSGGAGGGIVWLAAGSIQGNNRLILANGEDIFGGQDQNDGQGGGGGGGTIFLGTAQVNGSLRCELKGGEGGSNPYTPNYQLHGPGGGGGGGKYLSTQNFPNVITDLQGGPNGFSSQHLTNGAQPGAWGKTLYGVGVTKDQQPSHPVSTAMQLSALSPSCSGSADGSISILQSTALAFRLNGGPWQSDSVFVGLGPGTYQLGLQFSGGCTLDTLAQLIAAPPVLDSLIALANADCLTGGSLQVTAVSGTPPFSFQLDGGSFQNAGLFQDLSAGVHTLVLRDAKNCLYQHNYTIGGPLALSDTLLGLIHATCLDGGVLQVAASGGAPPFSFSLDAGPWQTGGTFSGIMPGSHQLQVRDAQGCVHTQAYAIQSPPPVLDTLIAVQEATCLQGGVLTWTALSGTPPFEYQIDMGSWQSSGNFSGLPAGDHAGVIRDAAGCTFSRDFHITTAPLPVDSLLSLINATCVAGGTVSLTAIDGVSPFVFNLDGGPWQAGAQFNGLNPGLHQFGLQDANGCLHFSDYTIGAAPPVSLELLHQENAGCINGGSLDLAYSGGTGPVEYSIGNGNWQSGGHFQDLPVGQYQFFVRDAAGCEDSSLYIISPPPPVFGALLSLIQATCLTGGTLQLTASGGTAPFAFSIDGNVWNASGLFENLVPGGYQVFVNDGLGCKDTLTYSIFAPPPAQLQINTTIPATCLKGGEMAANSVSGTSPYQFQVDNGPSQGNGAFLDIPAGNHLLILLDAAGCTDSLVFSILAPPTVADSLIALFPATCINGGVIQVSAVSGLGPFEYQLDSGPWQSAETFAGLPAGAHLLRLRDANGCVDSSLYQIPAPEMPSDSLIFLSGASCVSGGVLEIQGTGHAIPFEYRLNAGNWQTDGLFSNLSPGMYQVFVRDTAGCVDTSVYVITAPPALTDSIVALKNATCIEGGQLLVGALGGTPPFVYQVDGGLWQSSASFPGLAVGAHAYAIQDAAGCLAGGQCTVEAPPPLSDTLIWLKPAGCLEGGAFLVQAVSGTPPVTFQLGSGQAQATGQFSDLAPGTYSIHLMDAAFCQFQSQYLIPAPVLPVLELDSIQRVDCRHDAGFIEVSGSGGVAPLSFVLNPGAQAQANGHFLSLESGIYSVTLVDSAGCEAHLNQLLVPSKVDSFFSSETVTIYEGKSYALPDGRVVSHSGQFLFEYESQEGCDSLHLIDLQVLKRHIYIPNAIRPDDEGRNDFFTVFADASLESIERLSVYDRWGELVFERQDFVPNVESLGWDGYFRSKPVNPGVFVWAVRLRFTDGLVLDYAGNLTVLR